VRRALVIATAVAGVVLGLVPDAIVRAQAPLKGTLNVCHAGSLLAAFTQVEAAFAKQHPEVMIVDASGGSVDLGRRLAAGTLACDVYAPADHMVIDVLLKPAHLADFTIVFAKGRMVLAYMASDSKAGVLPVTGAFDPPVSVPAVAGGWQDTLTAAGVRISGGHPFLDPGGYRAHMIFELAQSHLRIPGLYNALLQHYQVTPADPGGVAPALGREFNFQFTYEHSAAAAAKRDGQYRYATLPEEIDLSGARGRQYNSSVTIPGLGTPFAAAGAVIAATAVEWGLTIPANASNRVAAIAFVGALLDAGGRDALTANGPAPIVPARATRADYSRIPETLKALVAAR